MDKPVSKDAAASGSPEAAMHDYIDAVLDKDAKRACQYIDTSKITADQCQQAMSGAGAEAIKRDEVVVGKATVKGDTATVPVSLGGGTAPAPMPMKKINGRWLVAFG